MSDNHEATPKKGISKLVALVAGLAAIGGGIYGAQAIAQGTGFHHMQAAAFDGCWSCRDHKAFHEMNDADIESRVTRMVRHLSIEIDATPDQESQIVSIATEAAKELRPVRERMHATAEELRHLLTQDQIDRIALEALRASRLAEADRISKTLVNAVADVAEVLTPEQRETLQQLIRERRERHRRHRG